ncbi:hypothetical protein GCM10010401_16570 [Rarobacter faecitabidus]|uniref:Release factor glutamine methyltransferase n=1 Tax=Rarobacter faecitabidus TaxID=13243 RepID=A0A542ZX62_RARFA|nr:peptide chain release factor N(5)-glutamine methyltransferase [Rarobacter faecitabidus]TQL64941.1 release factor glutamine methyltransferase [Rarobacter faecitabidus]
MTHGSPPGGGWRAEIDAATALLASAGVASPGADALALAQAVAGIPLGRFRAALITGSLAPAPGELDRLRELAERRARREPLQHILGVAHFRALTLAVGPGVFVPRPETEIVVAAALEAIAPLTDGAVVADLCAGSGAIGFAIADEFPAARVWSVELDRRAFEWTTRNHAALDEGTMRRVTIQRGDARTALAPLNGTVDLVVSNPPYVPPGAIPRDEEVAKHDPAVALYGLGPDGLAVPAGIVAAAERLLKPGGTLVMEHAEVQAEAARGLLDPARWTAVRTRPDLTGRSRMVIGRRTANLSPGASPDETIEESEK